MEKEEILQKAQHENKGKDLEDLEAQKKATNVAYTVGGLTILAIIVAEFNRYKEFKNYGVLAGLFIMIFSAFLTKFIVRKKKHELVVAIIYGAIAIGFFSLWIYSMCKGA